MGYGATMNEWPYHLLKPLSRKYRIIIFDNRGIGLSAGKDENFSIELFADDTAALMDYLGIEKAHVLGYSMGSAIAQELALNYPEKVSGLILYSTFASSDEMKNPAMRSFVSRIAVGGVSSKEVLSSLTTEKWVRENPDHRIYMPKSVGSKDPGVIMKQCRAALRWRGSLNRISCIEKKVLFIAGSDDKIIPPENSTHMAGMIKGSWVVQFKGGGHGLMYQMPEKMAETILCFLEIS
ncbi:alpha/beta hydrolase [Methanoplanus sp. FWC-SCC4]|uniref:Alpha/beta hydrolase n=2 Tax=Methanochimaera problematica TaxID=2609417 RepID=A0AA97FEJ9_9EURY|nr:alpha/beta hydrolase [Methanoplanus sp. FWC-SCC4]